MAAKGGILIRFLSIFEWIYMLELSLSYSAGSLRGFTRSLMRSLRGTYGAYVEIRLTGLRGSLLLLPYLSTFWAIRKHARIRK